MPRGVYAGTGEVEKRKVEDFVFVPQRRCVTSNYVSRFGIVGGC